LVSVFLSFSSDGWRLLGRTTERGCRRWTGFGLLIWPFAVEKTKEEEAAEEGASALMGLWALEERLEERSLSGMGDGGATVADFYG
jgi:hypothetical protein